MLMKWRRLGEFYDVSVEYVARAYLKGLCHDDAADHVMDRKATTMMMCMKCLIIQTNGPTCYKAAQCLTIVLIDIGTSLKLAVNTQMVMFSVYIGQSTFYNIGFVYSELMQYDIALNCYEKAALKMPKYAEASQKKVRCFNA
ncbi:hypothetical protein E3N88_34793 [Mikania micrantha]|uniref:CHY-type domain-containing protein n=1 Tax=Mikania micrantha TaxID=192012 RepID=A0A5N6M1T3_9ASTR|nr:hypothetical protein E3N88_34793 [Mikania micrantha]